VAFDGNQFLNFTNANQYQFAGLVDGEICSWTKNGKFDHEIFEHPDDLVIAEDEMWVYLFRSLGVNVLSFKIYPNYADALAAYTEKHQQKDLIGIFKLTEL